VIFTDEKMNDIVSSNNKYDVIYADPAWQYNDSTCTGAAEDQYTTMPLEAIKALPVNNITADDAMCFLWVTMPLLNEGLEVMEAWGFQYTTNAFTWIKVAENGKPRMMLGRWTRGNAELCILGKKGKCANWRDAADVHSVIEAPLTRHSEKPHIVRTEIERLLGERKRIELFGRASFKGWDVWGNQVDEYIPSSPSHITYCDKTLDMFANPAPANDDTAEVVK